MTLSPILKVLSTFRKQKVKALLIGGQACIVYGAAEFSRDSDFVVLASPANLKALSGALKVLKAVPVYFPELTLRYLLKGHSCHFRCGARGVAGLRVDIMSKLKGCDAFGKLWERRNRVKIPGLGAVDIISLEDLVQSKKTQRDKDWLMLSRLVENDIFMNEGSGSSAKVNWWLAQCRAPETLARLCADHPRQARASVARRPLLREAIKNNLKKLSSQLKKEETAERIKDLKYWLPLKKELEQLRLSRERQLKEPGI
ncbi:MAG TPA: hypothetical protein DCZ93_09580 [Elusimicrobia bacterium]|nr:hypothetical protein [Elusimicrobiota bacterium]